jgi:hypothetical protein
LLAYIKLEWKWLTGTNTLAYYDMVIITAVKSFIVPALVFKKCLVKKTDRRTDGQTDEQMDRKIERPTNRQTDMQSYIQADGQPYSKADRQAGRQAVRQSGRQAGRQIGNQADRWPDRERGWQIEEYLKEKLTERQASSWTDRKKESQADR